MDKDLFTQFVIYISIALSVCIVVVNTLCIGVIIVSPKLRRRPPTVFILNLLVTHLIQGVFVLPVYAVKKAKTYPQDLYPLVCDTWRLSYMLTFYGTCVNVFLVALDRLVATRFAVSSRIKLTTKRCQMVCGFAWFYMVSLCLIPFLPFLGRSRSLQSSKCNYNQPKEWTIFMLMANTVLPFVLVTVIYVDIVLIIRTHSLALKTSTMRKAIRIQRTQQTRPPRLAQPRKLKRAEKNNDPKNKTVTLSNYELVVKRIQRITKRNTINLRHPQQQRQQHQQQQRQQRQQQQQQQQQQLPKPENTTIISLTNRKLTWLSIKVCLTYGVTWLPSIIYYSIVTIAPDTFSDEYYVSDTEALVTFFIKYVTFFDAVLAPLIYCLQSGDFKRATRDLKKRFYGRKYGIPGFGCSPSTSDESCT